MRPVQYEACLGVVEGLLVDEDRIEFSPFMFLVTLDTGFRAHQAVIVLLSIDIVLDRLMAAQAVLIRNPPARLVTLQAVLMLEIVVSEHQGSWREELVQETLETDLRRVVVILSGRDGAQEQD